MQIYSPNAWESDSDECHCRATPDVYLGGEGESTYDKLSYAAS